LSGTILLWAIGEGNHPLQLILRSKIRQMSFDRWGQRDYTWVFKPCRMRKISGSPVWQNMVCAWGDAKDLLEFRELYNEDDVLNQPVWRPSLVQKDDSLITGSERVQSHLKAAGLLKVRNLLDTDGTFKKWETVQEQGVPNISRRAYIKLLNNISLPMVQGDPMKKVRIFVAPLVLELGSPVWEYEMCRRDIREI
jgi:hypothetical protein